MRALLGWLWLAMASIATASIATASAFAQAPVAAAAPVTAPAPKRPLAEALTLSPGATCLEEDVLARRVERWLERDRVDAAITVSVRGHAQRSNSVSFVIDRGADNRAERTIAEGPSDCDQLHSAVALSIALAIDASDAVDASAANGANAQGGHAAHVELPDDETLLEPAEKPGPRYFRLALAAFGHATSGVLTNVAWAGSARVEVGFLPWLDLRAGVVGTALADQTLDEVDEDDATFSVSLLAGRADACLAHGLALQFRAVVCAGALAGRFRTEGHGSALDAFVEDSMWFGGAGSIEAQAELQSWLALAVALDLWVPFVGHRIALQDVNGTRLGEPRELLPLGLLVGIGIVFRVF